MLPAAIDLRIKLYFKRNNSSSCTIYSSEYDSGFKIDLNKVEKSNVEWENYILGVIYYINILEPGTVKGFDCVIESELPIGAGISSSAALECGMAKGLNKLFQIDLSDEQIIKLSRDAEHDFAGTKCGIMDQFAVVKGKKDKLIKLNSQSLEYEYVDALFAPYKILLLNTNVSHNLGSSEYNIRGEECKLALQLIKEKYPNYQNLVDVPETVIKELKPTLTGKTFPRALYVTQENQRTLKASEALKDANLKAFGKYMYDSHHGLQHQYEVSCPELDFLVGYSKQHEAVIGSRMMGGGFGGCTINLVHADLLESYLDEVSRAYQEEFNKDVTPIVVQTGEGVAIK